MKFVLGTKSKGLFTVGAVLVVTNFPSAAAGLRMLDQDKSFCQRHDHQASTFLHARHSLPPLFTSNDTPSVKKKILGFTASNSADVSIRV